MISARILITFINVSKLSSTLTMSLFKNYKNNAANENSWNPWNQLIFDVKGC